MIPVHMLDHGFSLSCIKGQASCTPSIASSSLSSSLGPRTDTRFWGLRKGSLLLSDLGTLPLLPPSLKKENVRPAFPFLLPFYSICLLSWRSVQKLLASYLCLAVVPPPHTLQTPSGLPAQPLIDILLLIVEGRLPLQPLADSSTHDAPLPGLIMSALYLQLVPENLHILR